jgi:hypothetical protein
MLATIVDTEALWQTIVVAAVAGVGVTLVFSLAIFGAARFGEYTRGGHTVAATLSGALAILALIATLATIVVGIIVMTSK